MILKSLSDTKYVAVSKAHMDELEHGHLRLDLLHVSLAQADLAARNIAAAQGEAYVLKLVPVSVFKRHTTQETINE